MLSLAQSVRKGIVMNSVNSTNTTGELTAYDLLTNCTLAWHFQREKNLGMSREAHILDYLRKQWETVEPAFQPAVANIIRWAGHDLNTQHPVTKQRMKFSRVCYEFDKQYAFVVGVQLASSDAFPFPKEMIERALRQL